MSSVSYSVVCLLISFYLFGKIVGKKCEAPIYNDTIPLCLVDSNDTLELVGSTDGTWSTPLQTSLCQQNICNLTDLSYNLGGIYTFHSNAGSREVNVVIKAPPYITQCIYPADRKCDISHSRCNQTPVSAKLYYNSMINVTVEGYGAENYSVEWYQNCSSQPIICSNTRNCIKEIINSRKTNFILRFLDVEIRMKGLYFANISNDRGQQNYSYTEFNVVCPPGMPTPEKPAQSKNNQLMLRYKQSVNITFQFVYQKESLLTYIVCLGGNETSDCEDPECSCCSVSHDHCKPPSERPDWTVSLTAGDEPVNQCNLYRMFFIVQIPSVRRSDNQTLSLRFGADKDEIAQYSLTVEDPYPESNPTAIIAGATTGVLLLAVVGVVLVVIVICARRQRRNKHERLRENSFHKAGDQKMINNTEPKVTLISGRITVENQLSNGLKSSQSIQFDGSLNYRLSEQSVHLVDQRNSKYANI